MQQTAYCFTGLGADEQLFANIAVPGFTLKHIQWLPPLPSETLPQYAIRLSAQIRPEAPVLLGVSFGGMLAVEAAKHLKAKQTILISSVKTASHFPFYYHLANKLKIIDWLPATIFTTPSPVVDFLFGVETSADKKLLRHFIQQSDSHYIRWALQAIINWNNQTFPQNLVQIHGNKDRIIPLPKSVDHVIKDAGHLLVYNRAPHLNNLLQNILSSHL